MRKLIIGQAPMDGVTDAAFRFITDTYGKPDLLFTEFTSVEGIEHGAYKLLYAFIHHKTTTPTIAQIYGSEPELFYKAAIIACEMGFDGIDINMGCPDKSVTRRGAGAGLIKDPQRAKQIISSTRAGISDWSEGLTLEKIQIHQDILHFVREFQKNYQVNPARMLLPVSVKTRIGFDKVVTHDWIVNLLELSPAMITIHGRTLAQMYTGHADWKEIAKGAALAKGSNTLVLGNGDVKSLTDAHEKITTYKTDGVLIGRASFGNPWIFQDQEVTLEKRLDVALEHCRVFMKMTPDLFFPSLRKHLAWYCKGFDHAAEIRSRLMRVTSLEDVEKIIQEIKK